MCVYPKTNITIMLIIKKSPSAIVLSLTDRYQRIITEAAEVNGGICSFTHKKLHYLFIIKMRIRPIVNLNVLKLNLLKSLISKKL